MSIACRITQRSYPQWHLLMDRPKITWKASYMTISYWSGAAVWKLPYIVLCFMRSRSFSRLKPQIIGGCCMRLLPLTDFMPSNDWSVLDIRHGIAQHLIASYMSPVLMQLLKLHTTFIEWLSVQALGLSGAICEQRDVTWRNIWPNHWVCRTSQILQLRSCYPAAGHGAWVSADTSSSMFRHNLYRHRCS